MIIRNPYTLPIRYAFILATCVSAFLIIQQYAEYLVNDYDFEFSWFSVSAKILINYLLWATIAPVILGLTHKISKWRKHILKTILLHLTMGLLMGVAHRLTSIFIFDFIYYLKSGYYRNPFVINNQTQLLVGWFSSFLQYWIIIALLYAINYYRLYIEKQKELSTAQLNALKKQLQPHFLFNTLNSITSLIDIDGKKAQTMLAQLGFLLRQILEHDSQHFLSLEAELKYIKTYLDIEHTRFQDRMHVDMDVEKTTLNAKVPSLILQPLAENAVKHGISRCTDGGTITVTSKLFQNKLEIAIVNDFRPLNGSTKQAGYGIGILNIKKRLEQIYGNNFTFDQTMTNNKYQSKIVIPLEYISHD